MRYLLTLTGAVILVADLAATMGLVGREWTPDASVGFATLGLAVLFLGFIKD